MSGKYTIHLDPTVPPVQHARCKVPINYKEEIEKTLKEMEQLQIITPVTRPTEWFSSITYPTKPDGSLRICPDPHNLNKAIIREHYKAPILEEISHWLTGATIYSKLDTKMGSGAYIWTPPPHILQPSIPTRVDTDSSGCHLASRCHKMYSK